MTTADKTYNGHKDIGHWNVSLWINNDELLYRRAFGLVRKYGAKTAARMMYHSLRGKSTPDGHKYQLNRIYAAVKDILD